LRHSKHNVDVKVTIYPKTELTPTQQQSITCSALLVLANQGTPHLQLWVSKISQVSLWMRQTEP